MVEMSNGGVKERQFVFFRPPRYLPPPLIYTTCSHIHPTIHPPPICITGPNSIPIPPSHIKVLPALTFNHCSPNWPPIIALPSLHCYLIIMPNIHSVTLLCPICHPLPPTQHYDNCRVMFKAFPVSGSILDSLCSNTTT